MMPQALSSADLTHRPIWRDWMSGWQEGPSDEDYWKQVNAAADLIVRLVGNDPKRWSEVLDQLGVVPETQRKQLIDRLRNFPVDKVDPEERRRLAEQLRKIIQRHRDFADASWALPADSVDALEQALPRLLPEGICERHARLFDRRGNYEGMRAKIDRLRAEALREIFGQAGFDGVLKLADIVASPDQVGTTLAQTGCAPDSHVLPGLLRSSDDNHRWLAGAYTRDRIIRDGWDWVRSLSLEKWAALDAAALLCQAGLDPQAWKFAESLGKDVSEEYWKSVRTHGASRLDQQQFEFACQKLIEAINPEFAIEILYDRTFDEGAVSPAIIMDALEVYLQSATMPADDTLRVIQELFRRLQKAIPFADDGRTRRLAQLEWEFQLDGSGTYGAAPQTLVRCLSDYPKFFAELIAAIFHSTNEQQSETKATEEQQKRAIHGYRLLANWNRIPGSQSDGSIDEEQLLRWLESARCLCRDSGHLEIADSMIGEMLAKWPQPKDEATMWPCEQICDAIEEADSDDLDRGFQIGVLNSRGATWRSPLDGGDLERKERDKYRRWAERCDADWPRTAASLRKVAESYESMAQREDSRAAERAHERH
jgi:hypothetical protein